MVQENPDNMLAPETLDQISREHILDIASRNNLNSVEELADLINVTPSELTAMMVEEIQSRVLAAEREQRLEELRSSRNISGAVAGFMQRMRGLFAGHEDRSFSP